MTHLAWSWGVPTRLGRVGSGTTDPASEPDGFVMLAVYIAWSLHDTPGGEYMKQAQEHGFSLGGFIGLTAPLELVDLWYTPKGLCTDMWST